MSLITTINKCRLCDSLNIKNILDFGNIPLANNLRSFEDLDKEEFKAPLRIFQCLDCGSNQLHDEVNPELLFSNYNYASPPNLKNHFEGYARYCCSIFPHLNEYSLVVGIGGNNGLLEKEFLNLGISNVINVEPAKNIAELSIKNGVNTINSFFNIDLAKQIVQKYGKAQLITANNVFAHIPDLNEIVLGIKELLTKDGVFVFENAYLLNTIFNLDFGQVYSEHIFYHSIKPLNQFFKKHGLEIFDVQLNDVQLGSFRIFVSFPGNYAINNVYNLIKVENDFGLYREETYCDFNNKIDKELQRINKLIGSSTSVAIYGIPAKAVLLIDKFNLKDKISFAVDDSPIKQGKYVPGTKIPIKNSQFWKENAPEKTIIGAYNFAADIIKKNPYNGQWIIPFSKS